MKIGIITSGNDTFALFKFLQRYDHEYIIYYDFLNRSYGDKTYEYGLQQIQKGIGFLIKQGCEKIILPPIYELSLLNNKQYKNTIIPLFHTYLHKLCFSHSLVGKIGLFGDYADIQVAQKLVSSEAKTYKLNEHQKNTKKFDFPFSYRTKETTLWKYYLNELSYSQPMVNKVIKYDLRYFKDADIDTAIPLNYGYFNYQNTIAKFFNFKKTRFHKLETLEECFITCLPAPAPSLDAGVKGEVRRTEGFKHLYSVSVFYTDHCDFLQRSKKLLRLLQRGKGIEIIYEKIE